MSKHTLVSTQVVPADLGRVWSFFSDPRNLGRITPRGVGFQLHTPDAIIEDGATIDYTIRPLFGIPTGWRTLIDRVDAPRAFRDVQLRGPYRSWVHEHRFTPIQGGVRMDDAVEYELRFGALGELAHRWLVRAQLEHIFGFRAAAIRVIFEPPAPRPARCRAPSQWHRLRGQRDRAGASATWPPGRRHLCEGRGGPRSTA